MSLHWFDLAASIFLVASITYSSLRGFVKEVFAVLAWTTGYFGSIYLHPLASPYVKQVIKTSLIADLVTFFLLFAMLYISVRLLGVFAQKKLGLEKIPSEINHGAGAIMGVAKWVFFLAIFLSPLSLFPDLKASFSEKSIVADLIINKMNQFSAKTEKDEKDAGEKIKISLDKIKTAVKKKAKATAEILPAILEKAEKTKKKENDEYKKIRKKVTPIKKSAREKKTETKEDIKRMDDFINSL